MENTNKKIPLTGLLSAIQSGIPLLKQVVGLFKKTKTTPVETLTTMSQQDLVAHIQQLESGDEKSFLLKLGNLILTGATVYGIVWTAHHFGITYQEIITLFGLF